MKKILYMLLAGAMMISCSESFLDLSPEHYSNEATFFKTESHFTQALNGVYERLRGVTGVQGWVIGEMRSDNTHYIRNNTDRGAQFVYREEVADFINDDQNQWSNEMYYCCYNGISRANTVLDRIRNKNFSEEFINSVVGEAKFLRAFYYFQLVQTFGGVPLYLTEVTGVNNAFLPRASVDEVYKQIIDDVTEAIDKLKAPQFPQSGRATQGSARMLLAKVLLTKPEHDYENAETQLREIMKMGYELEQNYKDIFETSNKNNKESLFEVQYQQGDQGQHSDWLYYFIPRTANAYIMTGVPDGSTLNWGGWNTPTQDLIDSYESNDLRINVSIAVAAGHNDENDYFICDKVLSMDEAANHNYPVTYYFVNKYRHEHAKVYNTNDNWPVYRYADVLLLLAECSLHTGNTAEALSLMNQVRRRAGLGELSSVTEEDIANERRHEFAFENQRWYDLVRTGKAIEVMNEYGKKVKKQFPYLQERTYKVTMEKLLFAIPYREMQINSQLKQNKGY